MPVCRACVMEFLDLRIAEELKVEGAARPKPCKYFESRASIFTGISSFQKNHDPGRHFRA